MAAVVVEWSDLGRPRRSVESLLRRLGYAVAFLLCCASNECAVVVVFPFSCIDFGNRGACAPIQAWFVGCIWATGRNAVSDVIALRQRRRYPHRARYGMRLFFTRAAHAPLANMIAAPQFTVLIAGGLVGLGLTALYAPAEKAILAAIIALAQALSVFNGACARSLCVSSHARPTCGSLSSLSALALCRLNGSYGPCPTRARARGPLRTCGGGVRRGGSIARARQKSSRSMWDRGDAILVQKRRGASLLV